MNQLNKNLQAQSKPVLSDPRAMRFAFVQSRWHAEIVNQGREAFLAEMMRQDIPRSCIDIYEVPGAFEIPLHAKILAKTGRYTAIVACGLVVDGGIYRHEFVADAVIGALMALQLEMEIPMISAVLTPQHFHDHEEHRRFFREHFTVKGIEAARACVDTAASLASLRESTIDA